MAAGPPTVSAHLFPSFPQPLCQIRFEINDGKLWLCGETYGIITQFVINDKKAIRCNEKHLLIFWWKVLAEDKYTREYFPLYLGEQRD